MKENFVAQYNYGRTPTSKPADVGWSVFDKKTKKFVAGPFKDANEALEQAKRLRERQK